MKIGYFTDSYLPKADGISFSIENFRQALEAQGHEVYIFAARPSLRYRESSKRIIRFPAIKGLFYDGYLTTLFFPPREARKIEKLNLDIIHFHTPGQVGLLGAYYALHNDIPLVTTYHTDLYEYVKHYPSVLAGTIGLSMLTPIITGGGMNDYRSALGSIRPEKTIDRWNQKLVQRNLTMIHNYCDLVIAPSVKIQRQLEHWQTTSRLTTLPTGIDKLETTPAEITQFRRQYKIKPSDEVVLFVGRIGTEKNIGLLIQCFDQVVRARPDAKLLIVGAGDDLEKFQDEASQCLHGDRIIFTGHIPRQRLGAIYASAKLFAFPSLTDTQGLAVNEAAQAGLPIVMVDHDISEVVISGQNGYYSKDDPAQLAKKIISILRDPARQKRFAARSAELAQNVTIPLQARKLSQLYEQTISQHVAKPKRRFSLQDPWPF